MKSNVKLAYKRIVHRRKMALKEVKSAIKKKDWEKVPFMDGIELGLLIAERIIREECPETVHL